MGVRLCDSRTAPSQRTSPRLRSLLTYQVDESKLPVVSYSHDCTTKERERRRYKVADGASGDVADGVRARVES